jgi:hypothetical protein
MSLQLNERLVILALVRQVCNHFCDQEAQLGEKEGFGSEAQRRVVPEWSKDSEGSSGLRS